MLSKIYTVFCDTAGCPKWAGESVYADEARRTARKRGWKRVARPGGPRGRGADYCPTCAPNHPEAK